MMNTENNHVMIDLETMGTSCIAAIISIGVVKFNFEHEMWNLYHKGIHLDSCVKAGMDMDASTVLWWIGQPKENQDRLLTLPKTDLKDALEELFDAFNTNGLRSEDTCVWSHGSNFDTVIIENACKLVGVPLWWKYKNIRDTRTLFDACNYTYKSKGGHDALEDAINQAEAVIACCTQ